MTDVKSLWDGLLPPSPFTLVNAQKNQELGQQLGRSLSSGTVICLLGDLGVGKTTLVQGIGTGLGIVEPIVSPTFTLLTEYHDGRMPLYHFDLYRLQPSQVESLAPELYWEGIEFPPGLTVIEWSDRLPYFPPTFLEIRISHASEGREVQWRWNQGR